MISKSRVRIIINAIYGCIYGGIIVFFLLVAVIINRIPSVASLPFYSLKKSVPEYADSGYLSNQDFIKTRNILGTFGFNPFICTFKRLTGIPCLICGGTRSFFHFAHLGLKKSALMNPLVFSGIVLLLFYGLVSIAGLSTGRKELIIFLPGWLKRMIFVLIIGAVLINWAYLIFIGKP